MFTSEPALVSRVNVHALSKIVSLDGQSDYRCHGPAAVYHVQAVSRLYQLQEWTPHQGAFHVFNSMAQLLGDIFQITDF